MIQFNNSSWGGQNQSGVAKTDRKIKRWLKWNALLFQAIKNSLHSMKNAGSNAFYISVPFLKVKRMSSLS